MIARRSSAAVAAPRTVGTEVGDGARDGVADLVGEGAVGDGLCVCVDEGSEDFVDAGGVGLLAGAAEVDSPVLAVGLADLRSFTSSAASKIPMPRSTTASTAAMPRLRRGSVGRGTGLATAGAVKGSDTEVVKDASVAEGSGTGSLEGGPVWRSTAIASATARMDGRECGSMASMSIISGVTVPQCSGAAN